MKNKIVAISIALNFVCGMLYSMQKGDMHIGAFLTPDERFQIRVGSFDKEVGIIGNLPCQTMQDAGQYLSLLKQWEKHFNSIQQDLKLSNDDVRVQQRRELLESSRERFKNQLTSFQADGKKNKTASRKLQPSKKHSDDAFLDQCVKENEKAFKKSPTNVFDEITHEKTLLSDRERQLHELRKIRAAKAAYRSSKALNDKWYAENRSDSDDDSDSDCSDDQNQNKVLHCQAPVTLHARDTISQALDTAHDRLQAATVDQTWRVKGKKVNIDAFYFTTDGSHELSLTEAGDFPAGIKEVQEMRLEDNTIYMNVTSEKVGCDSSGTYFFKSQTNKGKAYSITNVLAILRDKKNPMVKFFRIMKQGDQLVLKDNLDRDYALHMDDGIYFVGEGCRYKLKKDKDGYSIVDLKKNEEYYLLHGYESEERLQDNARRQEKTEKIKKLLRSAIPVEQLQLMFDKKASQSK